MPENTKRFQHSFRKTLLPQDELPKNQFGHTMNGDVQQQEKDIDIDYVIDPIHGLQVNTNSILDSASSVLINMYQNISDDDPRKKTILEQIQQMGLQPIEEEIVEEEIVEEEKQNLNNINSDFIDKILAIDTEDDGETEDVVDTNTITNWMTEQQKRIIRKPSLIRNTEENKIPNPIIKNQQDIPIKQIKTHICNCGTETPINAKFCPECGESLISKFCIECGFEYKNKEKFCPECGQSR